MHRQAGGGGHGGRAPMPPSGAHGAVRQHPAATAPQWTLPLPAAVGIPPPLQPRSGVSPLRRSSESDASYPVSVCAWQSLYSTCIPACDAGYAGITAAPAVAAAFPVTLAAVAEVAATQQAPLPAPLPEAPLAAMPDTGPSLRHTGSAGTRPELAPAAAAGLDSELRQQQQQQQQLGRSQSALEQDAFAAPAGGGFAAVSASWAALPEPEPQSSSPALPVQGAAQRPTLSQLQQVGRRSLKSGWCSTSDSFCMHVASGRLGPSCSRRGAD